MSSHLGGHLNITHLDDGALSFLMRTHGSAKSFLDIGCGPGGMLDLARQKGLQVAGVEGDPALPRRPDVHFHDYTKDTLVPPQVFDLVWCVEFVEHVEERFMSNFLETIRLARYSKTLLLMTAAPPGVPGFHHVNCKVPEYWLGALASVGFRYDTALTSVVRAASTMPREFVRERGMLFVAMS